MNTTCICILNYNNGMKTIDCISGILVQTLQDYRILVIDNNSTDDSLALIQEFLKKKQLPFRFEGQAGTLPVNPPGPGEIIIIRSERNGGYSCGNNLGIRLARSLNIFSHILIINNDVVLKEDFLEETVKRYEVLRKQHNSTRIALGAAELGTNGKVSHSGFHYIHLLSGLTFSSPVFPAFKYIPGSCIFTDIGAPLMDESFFLYFDDTQYSKILLRNGYILESSPRSVLFHEVGGTVMHDLQRVIFKSLRRFYLLNYPYLLPVVIPIRLLLMVYLYMKSSFRRFITFTA